jgi:pimeloyl-ACP methyl ester carboxylesterase
MSSAVEPVPLRIDAGVLSVAGHRHGPRNGWPVVLLHGFPYDHHSYDSVAPRLAAAGADVIVVSLRGYGETRFRAAGTLRSGQQAALGRDLLALLDALELPSAVLAGYDWGGRAACVVAALWPDRARGLVTANGYNIQNIAAAGQPADPSAEHRLWYQYYLHGERGRRGLAENRASFARLLWSQWSPTWTAGPAAFATSAPSFDNPDFVDVVVHSYRHRYGLVVGDPAYADDETALAAQPTITVPTVSLDGADDGVNPPQDRARREPGFSRLLEHRVLPGVGHNVAQEAPEAFAAAVLDVHRSSAH